MTGRRGESGPYPLERLVPYDPAWAVRFAGLAAGVVARLGAAWAVEHVGSTSVPGLVAKPVVDLALRAPDGVDPADGVRSLLAAGWSGPVDLGSHIAVLLLDTGGVRRAIAHLFAASRWEDAEVRLLADRLRRYPAEAAAYARLKEGLVAQGCGGGRTRTPRPASSPRSSRAPGRSGRRSSDDGTSGRAASGDV